uniref:terminase small subunit n=1 Tax=Acetobacter nitrogenifigens TaxID=285268 RepID=UPI001FF078CE|nr:terminase small subunit [Acetobacter nitrogenifigens]
MLLSSDQSASSGPPMATPMLNKRQMGNRLGVSSPTMTAWLERWPDFPVVERGTNGASYSFDPEAVFKFLAERREEEALSRSGRDEALMALQLTFAEILPDPPQAPGAGRKLSTKEEIDLWKLRDLKQKAAKESRALVIVAEVERLFENALVKLSRDAGTFIRRLGQQERWPDAQIRSVEARFAEMQRKSVSDALATLESEPDDHERQLDLT